MLLFLMFLLLIFIVVSTMLIVRHISFHVTKDRELAEARESTLAESFQKVNEAVSCAVQLEKLVMDRLYSFDDIIKVVEEQIVTLTSHMDEFNSFAKSDMVAARRNELTRARESQKVLERILSITTLAKQNIATSDMLALDSIKSRIMELEGILSKEG